MFDLIAERKIAEALARGELENLPGEGRPLELDDDALVPEDLRLAYRILKNAGFVPAEVDELNRIGQLALLRTRIENRYYEKALAKLGR